MTNKGLVALGISFCVLISSYKLYKVYLDHTPIAKPGECVELNFEGSKLTFKIISDDRLKGEALTICMEADLVGPLSYEEMRAYKGHKVNCP